MYFVNLFCSYLSFETHPLCGYVLTEPLVSAIDWKDVYELAE